MPEYDHVTKKWKAVIEYYEFGDADGDPSETDSGYEFSTEADATAAEDFAFRALLIGRGLESETPFK